jgi:hypothetical protein
VRPDKDYTLAQSLSVRVFGRVNLRVVERVRVALVELTAIVP